MWRLNAAAAKAKIDTTTPEGLRNHVARFVKTITDVEVRRALVGSSFMTIVDLEDSLKLMETQLREINGGPKPPRAVTARSQQPAQAAVAYWAYDQDEERNNEDPDYERHVRFEDEEAAQDEEEPAQAYPVLGERQHAREGRAPISPRAGPSSGPGPRGSPGRRQGAGPSAGLSADKIICHGCKGMGHFVRDCPSRLLCSECHVPGHAAEFCPNRCKLCKEVHESDDDCKVLKAVEALRAWNKSKAKEDGGNVPADLLNQLN